VGGFPSCFSPPTELPKKPRAESLLAEEAACIFSGYIPRCVQGKQFIGLLQLIFHNLLGKNLKQQALLEIKKSLFQAKCNPFKQQQLTVLFVIA